MQRSPSRFAPRLVSDSVRRPTMRGFGDDAPVDGYELIDAGGGARLERFGEHVTDRPHGGAYGERRAPERWEEADLRFDRDGGWSGPGLAEAGEGWTATIGGLDMGLRPTEAGQVGCFPGACRDAAVAPGACGAPARDGPRRRSAGAGPAPLRVHRPRDARDGRGRRRRRARGCGSSGRGVGAAQRGGERPRRRPHPLAGR